MSSLLSSLHLLLMMFAGWVNRYQLDVIEYLREENRLLKERLGDRPIHFTDAERRRLARKAKMLRRKVLNELETLVTPDTLMRPDDLPRTGVASSCRQTLHGALSCRAESPRTREPTTAACATRRHAMAEFCRRDHRRFSRRSDSWSTEFSGDALQPVAGCSAGCAANGK